MSEKRHIFEARGEAKAIAAHALEETGQALLDRDFDRFAPFFALPQTLATPAGGRKMETLEDLRSAFDGICAFFASSGVISLDRRVETAFFDGADVIRYTHATRLVRKGAPEESPYFCQSVMQRGPSGWKVTDSQYALGERDDHARALLAGRSDDDQDSEEAWSILQRVLTEVTQAYLENDFDLLLSRVQFPLFMQGDQGTQVIDHSDTLRRDLERYQTEFVIHGITDIIRTVKSAERLGKRRIQGIYRTHVLRCTDLLFPAYTSSMSLEQGDDQRWRMTAVLHPMGHLSKAFRDSPKRRDGAT